MDVLKVENLAQSFGGLQVLQGLSFSLKAGEKVALIGPNGAGKTTLINILNGLIRPKTGRIYLLGHDITNLPPHARVSLGLARSFQIIRLFPHLTLLTNVLLAIQGVQTTRYQMIRPITAYANSLIRAQGATRTGKFVGRERLSDYRFGLWAATTGRNHFGLSIKTKAIIVGRAKRWAHAG